MPVAKLFIVLLGFIGLVVLKSQAMLPGFVVKKLAGNFAGPPDSLESNVSPYALELIDSAFADIDSGEYRDYHVHLVGLGQSGTETFVNSKFTKGFHPIQKIKLKAYLSASGVTSRDSVDIQYRNRLHQVAQPFKGYGKLRVLGFDFCHHKNGARDSVHTEFYISNKYSANFAALDTALYKPILSVHPFRPGATQELKNWASKGYRLVKWLPNAMAFSPDDTSLTAYYETLVEENMAILTHTGIEKAVEAEAHQEFGNPLRFRRALDMGVTVIMAHCASLGKCKDIDHPEQPTVSCFSLFMRMMDEEKYRGKLFGEISALTQFNRDKDDIIEIMERVDLHPRLVHGSDYPLPGFNFIISTEGFVKKGMLTEEQGKALNEIYSYNPLLFDFVLKRTLRTPHKKAAFSPGIFMRNPGLPLE